MTNLITRTALFVAALFSTYSMAAEPAAAVQSMPVYGLALEPGWDNWSWAKTELSVDLTGSARKPIKVQAGPYQAMYLHHAPFATNGFKKISLLIQGSAAGGEVRLFMLSDGKVNGDGKLIKLDNTGWTQVVVPIATLASEDKLIDGIWLQNAGGTDLPRFYVTEIKIE